jgi:hypothetical protein
MLEGKQDLIGPAGDWQPDAARRGPGPFYGESLNQLGQYWRNSEPFRETDFRKKTLGSSSN